MGDMNVPGGGQPHHYSEEQINQYKKRYEDGLGLFQKSFEEYRKPNVEVHKHEQLKKVMNEALHVMNETASVALNEQKKSEEKQLEKTYDLFLKNPDNHQYQKDIEQQIQSLKE